MSSQTTALDVTRLSARWLARIGSLFSIGLIFLFFIGFHPTRVAPKEWIGLAFFPLGVVVGMIVAWWKEDVGASITLLSLFAFYVVYGLLLGSHIHGWAFIAFSSPSFLFLLYSILSRVKFAEALS